MGATDELDPIILAHLRAWAAGWPELGVLRELAAGRPVHLVGGALRDALLHRHPQDADLVIPNGSPELIRRLATRVGGSIVHLHDDPPTRRLVLADGRTLDLADYRGVDLAADLMARDLTVNALALDLEGLLSQTGRSMALVDPTGGLADLRRGRLRSAGPTSFSDDPLRVVRLYRFRATFGWRLTPTTRRQVRRQRRLVTRPARERSAAELVMILTSQRVTPVLQEMLDTDLLAWLPADRPGRLRHQRATRPQSRLRRLQRLTRLLQRAQRWLGDDSTRHLIDWLETPFGPGRTRRALLAWLALLLDNRPRRPRALWWPTRRREPQADRSAGLSALHPSRREDHFGRTVAAAVDEALLGLDPGGGLARQQLGELGLAAPGALLLTWADRRQTAERLGRLRALLDLYWSVVVPLLATPPLINGDQLMAECNLPAGPHLSRLITALRQAQLRGEIASTAEALAYARWLLEPPAMRPSPQ